MLVKKKKETEEYARRKGVTVEEIRELRTKWRERERERERERKIPKPVKDIVWNRDGGCCRYSGSTVNIEYYHIYPFSKGGSSSDIDNIQLLCRECNAKKVVLKGLVFIIKKINRITPTWDVDHI